MTWTPIRQLRIQVVAAVAFTMVLIWGTVAYQLGSERDAALRVATQQGQNLSGVVAEHFSSYAATVDLMLTHLRIQWTRDPKHFADTVALEESLRKDKFLFQVAVIDQQGWLVYSNAVSSKERVFLGDREHFKVHRNNSEDQLYISNPIRGRVSGRLSIQFTRAILDERGRFSGVLVFSVAPDALAHVYQGLDLGSNGVVGIRRLDNTLLLRWPGIGTVRDRPLPEIPSSALGTADAANDIRRAGLSGVERIFSFRRIPGFPLYAVVGQSVESVLAEHNKERHLYFAAGGGSSVVVLLFGLLMLSKLKREERVESELSKSEQRFRSLTRLASDVYWEQDDQYRFTSFSGSGPEWLIKGRQEGVGKRRWDSKYDNMTEKGWIAHIALLDARKPFHDLELCRLDESGRKVWISVSGEPVFDASGVFTGYRGIGRDITERKRVEQLQALEHAVNRSIANTDSVTAAIHAAVRAICETEDWECGRYFLWSERDGVLRFSDAWSVPVAAVEQFIEKSRDLSYAPGTGLAGRVWQTGQPLWVPDVTRDSRVATAGLFKDTGMRGAFVFPVMAEAEGKPIGVLAFNSRKVREPDERLLQAVRVIGSQIGQFLRRKQSEEERRRFRTAMDVSEDMIVLIDRTAMRFVDVNDTACRLLGYTREELLRIGPQDVLPVSREELERSYDKLIANPNSDAEVLHRGMKSHYICKDGTLLPFESTRHVLRSGDTTIIAAISRDIRARLVIEEKLAYMAQFDALTGLPNRNLFQDRLTQAMALAKRNDWPMAVLFIDLDRFKLVNDTLGHGAGDKLLKEAAERLRSCTRSSDTVGRLGGDEFAAILSELGKPDDAGLVAQKIIDVFKRPFDLDGKETFVTASVGITLYPADSDSAETLVVNADAAMYRAKERGRNNYQYFTRDMNERALQRGQMEAALRRALEREEFRLHYQPKVELARGAISGFEALLRWQHPERGLVSPADFVPILEDTGLIVPVGEWVLRAVCGQIKAWQAQGIKPPPIAINVSARQFQKRTLNAFIEHIREAEIDPSLIGLELTESLLMKDAEEAVRILASLKAIGVRLSVDDFGTGYSSLAYLKRFPLDELKVDRIFVSDVTTDPDGAEITLAIISLAHSLRLKAVAEGVETEGQLRFLCAHGCDEMQGYYFSRPMPVPECTQAMIEGRRLQIPITDAPLNDTPLVLFVDDNQNDVELMQRALEPEGYRTLGANSPQAALEVLATHTVNIVISDQNMPAMTGVKFLSVVRKLYPRAIRIVMSGVSDIDTVTNAVNEAGIHKFLSKNWDAARLRSEVREAYLYRDNRPA
jgi:diguanylate cyclase (GGDEF)-like protein/PAS domain S-box-containing protein